MDRTEITAHLRQVPDLIDEIIDGLSDEALRRRPSPDEWSILEVCCHLRDAAEEEGVRVRRLAEEENPTLAPYDEEAWAIERDYQGDDIRRVRTALRAFWGGLAYQLEGLTDEQWERGGSHPEIGLVTVRSYAELAVEHGQAHLAQLKAIREGL
ncbi:MAG: DinB family protein [Dehalococcoidia bacterium]|nr:DinB family protein [Dehalococcoidia bacterium]